MKDLTQFSEPHDFQSLAVILLEQAVELVSPTRPSQNVRRKMAAKLREALAVLDQATNQGVSTEGLRSSCIQVTDYLVERGFLSEDDVLLAGCRRGTIGRPALRIDEQGQPA